MVALADPQLFRCHGYIDGTWCEAVSLPPRQFTPAMRQGRSIGGGAPALRARVG